MPKKKQKKAAKRRENEETHTIAFDYIKSNCFRVIHVDGVHGGPTPGGDKIQMGLFSERTPIPLREEYSLTDAGKLGERTKVAKRDALIREVEVEAILSLPMARRLVIWLEEKLKAIDDIQKQDDSNG